MLGSCYDCIVPRIDDGCEFYRDGTVACSHFKRDEMLDIIAAGNALVAASRDTMRVCPLIEAGCVGRVLT